MSNQLGKHIRGRRIKLRISQVDLAAGVGRSHAWLSLLERGQVRPPADVITALAIRLGELPEDYLRLAGRSSVELDGKVPSISTITLSEEQLESLLERSAEMGARRALAEHDCELRTGRR